jgi:hypothetical protein
MRPSLIGRGGSFEVSSFEVKTPVSTLAIALAVKLWRRSRIGKREPFREMKPAC